MPILKWWCILAWPLMPITLWANQRFCRWQVRKSLSKAKQALMRMGMSEQRAEEAMEEIKQGL
jgi:hypothetical protein